MTQEKTEHEIVEEMSQVVEQMRIDDLEDNPDIANEFFLQTEHVYQTIIVDRGV